MNVQNNQNQPQDQNQEIDLDALFDEAAETTPDEIDIDALFNEADGDGDWGDLPPVTRQPITYIERNR